MHEAHAPHELIHSWKTFFVHIATIVIGLLIAVMLEQAVEYFHHRHQRVQLEEQMREALDRDMHIVTENVRLLTLYREYLGELRSAAQARRDGLPALPLAMGDPRSTLFLSTPNLAPYEAARENGTVTLLAAGLIRQYSRISYQRDRLLRTIDQFNDAANALVSLRQRWGQSTTIVGVAQRDAAVDLAKLSPGEVSEYLSLIGTALQGTDQIISRLQIFHAQCRAILEGAADEAALLDASKAEANAKGVHVPAPTSTR